MKKELLFIIDSLACGGAEKSLVSLLPLIDFSKYDVDLLILDAQRDKHKGVFEKYVPAEVNVLDYHLFGKTVFEKIRKFFFHARLSPQLRLNHRRHGSEIYWRSAHFDHKCLKKHYDVGIAYQQGIPTFFLAEKVWANKKLAWINVNIFADGYDIEYCNRFYKKMDGIIAVSNELYSLLGKELPWMKDRLRCVYDIVNQDVIRDMAKFASTEMDCNKSTIKIVTVGRLVDQKNYLLACESAKILADRGFAFKWYFVGEGVMRKSIEKRIHELCLQQKVFLLGFKENPYPYMSQADIYVQTSSYEGFCLTLAEARILHRPIVSTNFDVVHDQIIDRENGLIADITPESVADKIQELIENESLRNKIIQNLKKENNTTSTTEIQKFYSIIEN